MKSFPFDSHVTYDSEGVPSYDRAISSDPYRSLLKELFKTGIMPDVTTNMKVSAEGSSMAVTISAGFAIVEGCMAKEDSTRTLTLEDASTSYDRIDTIVLRLDTNDSARTCDYAVVTGTPASSPVHPDLTRTASVYEIGLADVLISSNSTVISESKITDTRYDSSRCGVISSISEFDTTAIYDQIQSDLTEFREDYEEEMTEWTSEQKSEFIAWLNTLKDLLDSETAGHLQNEISALDTSVSGLDTRVTALEESGGATEIIASDYSATTTYNANDEVIYNKQMWKCLATCVGQTPEEGTYWTNVTVGSELKSLNTNLSNLLKYESYTIKTQYDAGAWGGYSGSLAITLPSGYTHINIIDAYSNSYALPALACYKDGNIIVNTNDGNSPSNGVTVNVLFTK